MQNQMIFAKGKVKASGGSDFVKIKDQKFKLKDLKQITVNQESKIQKKEHATYNFTKNETPNLVNPNSPAPLTLKQWNDLILMQKPYLASKMALNLTETQLPPASFKVLELAPLKEAPLNLTEIETIIPPEFKLIEALTILNLKENYELALALLSEVLDDPRYSTQARWSVSKAAIPLGLRQEGIYQLFQVEKASEKSDKSEWKDKTLKSLIDLTKTTDEDLAKKIYSSSLASKIDPQTWGSFAVAIAKSLMEEKKLQDAISIIQSIPEDSPYKVEGQFVKAIIEYRSNQIDLAITDLKEVLDALEKKKVSWDLKSLAAITLGRIYFQLEDYPKAFAEYQKIDKNNSMWLQSLIESSWSQILSKDYEGAAGNMFSLHTDFFKGAYQPESYIVRTVSYLNLCQFGDSLTVLQQFLRKYSHTDKLIDDYMSHSDKTKTYDTVKKILSQNNLKDVNGLPRALIIEMARDSKFLSIQKKINDLEDEISAYTKIQNDLKDKEKKWQAKIDEIKKRQQQIKVFLKEDHDDEQKAAVEKESANNDKKIAKLKLLQEVTGHAYTLLQKFQKESIPRLQNKKEEYKKTASLVLYDKLQYISKDLKHWLEQSELLHYEIYSGAGEHLRYQMGTNETKPQPNEAEVKAKKAEAHLQWDFHGEIWEDEIGHFRSSLKNVCPTDDKVTGSVTK